MALPPDPRDPRDQDAFDFGGSSRQQSRELLTRLLGDAETRPGVPRGQRQHLAIAAGAVGVLWIAPIVAGARRKRRRRERRAADQS